MQAQSFLQSMHHPKANAVSAFAILVRSPFSKPHRCVVAFDFSHLFLADLLQADRKPFSFLLSALVEQKAALRAPHLCENLSNFVTETSAFQGVCFV
jgi:hypothetical protein